MKGYDQNAVQYILNAMKEDAVDTKNADKIITSAMKCDLMFMEQEGIITDGEYSDSYYDDDDAFDFIIEKLSEEYPKADPYRLTELLECYFEYHDKYMEENGLLEWN